MKFPIDLRDDVTDLVYTIFVTADEQKRLTTDKKFRELKIKEARESLFASDEDEPVEWLDDTQPGCSETKKAAKEDQGFRWPHEAILLLVDEYRKREDSLNAGKISHRRVWTDISRVMEAVGQQVTWGQCQSKFSGLKKTYKHIKDHNKTSGNSTKTWPYFQVMDDLLGRKPSIAPVAVCTSDAVDCGHSDSKSLSDDTSQPSKKPRRNSAADDLIRAIEERRRASDAERERRHRISEEKRDVRHQENILRKDRALNLFEKFLNQK